MLTNATASQILSLVVLFGCKSPSMKSLYLVRIDRDELIDSTIGKTKIKADDLNLDELPLH